MKISKELKTGLLAILALLLFIFGYSFLKGKNIFDKNLTFYAKYDNVYGLTSASMIYINGLEVGKVTKVDFVKNTQQLYAEMVINKDLKFTKNSIAKINGGGLLGGASISIIPKFNDNYSLAKSGDTLVSMVEPGILDVITGKLNPLEEKIERAIQHADSTLMSINRLLQNDNQQNIQRSLQDLSTSMANLKKITAKTDQILSTNEESIGVSLSNLKHSTDNMRTITDSLAQIEFSSLVSNLEQTLAEFKSLGEKLNSDEGSLALLLNDEKLYNNLEASTKELELLLQDFRLNPKRYVHFSVFGKKAKPYTEPEE
ncbi:MAG: MlaD family protein [Flavobacteriaceae bacterium]|nr:MlaD family protein [Flavobacteriaceae bacterium]